MQSNDDHTVAHCFTRGIEVRKGERTRQEIIRKAAPIFHQKGHGGAALSDLMRATGLEKAESTSALRFLPHLAAAAPDPGLRWP